MAEYVLKPDGAVIRRPIALTVEGEREVSIDDDIIATLTVNTTRKIRSYCQSPIGDCLAARH